MRVKYHFLSPAARRLIDCVAGLAFCAMPAFTQPAFEVASLKPSQPYHGCQSEDRSADG